MGRPKGSKTSKTKRRAKIKHLRLKFYDDMPSSKGGVISGIADQYGRILKEFKNAKGELDIMPTGHTIAARH